MKKKRILFSAYAFYPEFGGLEQQIYLLAKEFQKKGYEVDVLTEKTRPELEDKEIIDGITVHRITECPRNVFGYLILVYELSKFIIVNRKEYRFIILRAALTLYPIVFGFWKKLGVISVPSFVTADTGGENDEIIQLKQWPLWQVMRYFLLSHNYFNSICTSNHKHYLELKFPKNKLTQIPNGLVIPKELNSSTAKKVSNFFFIGRFIKEKGLLDLLKAFKRISAKYPKAKLHLIGDGPYMPVLLDYVKTNRLKKIKFHGVLTGKKKQNLLKKFDCLCFPSYSEGFGLAVLEAAVLSKYIIATDVADLRKIYKKNISFVRKKDVDSLYRAMRKIIENPPSVDYSEIVAKFDIKIVANKIHNLLLSEEE